MLSGEFLDLGGGLEPESMKIGLSRERSTLWDRCMGRK